MQLVSCSDPRAQAHLSLLFADESLHQELDDALSRARPTRVELACDRALQALSSGCYALAMDLAERALLVHPGHAETRRLLRFLEEAGESAPTLFRAPWRARSRIMARDADALRPRDELGGFSAERLSRMAGCGALFEPAPAGTGLWALQEAGCLTRILGMRADYAKLPADDPLVFLEILADECMAFEAVGRSPREPAEALWEMAERMDPVARDDVAQLLCTLAVQHPEVRGLGLEGAARLIRSEPWEPLWQSFRCRILASSGPSDAVITLAESVISRVVDASPVGETTLRLAIDSLRILGREDLARQRLLELATSENQVEDLARELLLDWGSPTFATPVLSDRVQPRADDIQSFPSSPC